MIRPRLVDKQTFTYLPSQSALTTPANITLIPPNFTDFQFSHIGQPAELLKRLTEPHQGPYHSPTSSPPNSDQVSAPDPGISSSFRHRSSRAIPDCEPLAIMNSNTTRHSQDSDPSLNAINVTGSPVAVSLSVTHRPAARRSSDTSLTARESVPFNRVPSSSSPSQSHSVTLTRAQSLHPPVSHETMLGVPRFQIDSPNSVTACDDSVDSFAMPPLPRSNFEQFQSRLGTSLNALAILSSSVPPSIATSVLTAVPLSATAHALHHAQHTAHVAVKGANASIDIAQTMHTLAHHSQDAALRAFELAQQSLAAAQAAHAAAEQSSAGAQATLVGAREARERAHEAVDAVKRVKAVLDAHEQDIAGREERVRNVVINTRSIIEEIRLWATDLEQAWIRENDRRRRSWKQDERGEDKQWPETNERRLVPETEANRWLGNGGREQITSRPTQTYPERRQAIHISDGQETAERVTAIVSVQSDQMQQQIPGQVDKAEASKVTTSQKSLATGTGSQDDSQRAQEMRRQEAIVEKEPNRLAGQIGRDGNGTSSEVMLDPSLNAFVRAVEGPLGSTTALIDSTALQRPNQPDGSTADSTNMATSNALRNTFIPATTDAGRLVLTDLPFSSITLASKNGTTARTSNRTQQAFYVTDSSPLSELSSTDPQDAIPDKSSLIRPDSAKHSGGNSASRVVHGNSPLSALPTWTVLKSESSGDAPECEAENAGETTESMRPVSIASTPPATSHHEIASNLRHRMADAGGVNPNKDSKSKVKTEPNSNDAVVLPPRKANRAGFLGNMTSATHSVRDKDAGTALSQRRPPVRSVSPTSSMGITPPRMKKLKGTRTSVSREPAIANDGLSVVNTINPGFNVAGQSPSNDNDDVLPQVTPVNWNGAANGGTRGRQVNRRRSPDVGWRWASSGNAMPLTPGPRSHRVSDNQNQSEYTNSDRYRGKTAQNRDGFVRGNNRLWVAKSSNPVRSPSPISRQWPDSPPRRPSVRRDLQRQGNAIMSPPPRSSPPLGRFSRPNIYQRRDLYSPPSSPPAYNRDRTSSRPPLPPTSPQIGGRKRLRESNSFIAPSDVPPGRRSWHDDSDGRRWPVASDFSPPSRSRRTPSLPRTLASRMQEPVPLAISSTESGPNDTNSKRTNSARADGVTNGAQGQVARPIDDYRVPSRRSSFSDRERDYERDELGAPSVLGKRKKFRENPGAELPQEPDGDRPHLLARMSDQTRSLVRGLGSPIRGLTSNGRGYDRGRGFGRGRGAPFPRGGFRGSGNRMKPLQDRIH